MKLKLHQQVQQLHLAMANSSIKAACDWLDKDTGQDFSAFHALSLHVGWSTIIIRNQTCQPSQNIAVKGTLNLYQTSSSYKLYMSLELSSVLTFQSFILLI